MFGQEKRVYDFWAPRLEAEGFELVRVKLMGKATESSRQTLQIMIDSENENGVTIGDCQKVSRQMSVILDVEDPIDGEYTLEVSSPGIDRPLTKLAHYEKFTGSRVILKTLTAYDGQRRFQGTLTEVIRDEQGHDVVVIMGLVNSEMVELHFPYVDIESAQITTELLAKNKKKGRK